MSLEMLKEVTALVSNLGMEAKFVFVLYIVLASVPSILWAFGGIFLLYLLIVRGSRAIVAVSVQKELRTACGLRGGEWGSSELNRAIEILSEHY